MEKTALSPTEEEKLRQKAIANFAMAGKLYEFFKARQMQQRAQEHDHATLEDIAAKNE